MRKWVRCVFGGSMWLQVGLYRTSCRSHRIRPKLLECLGWGGYRAGFDQAKHSSPLSQIQFHLCSLPLLWLGTEVQRHTRPLLHLKYSAPCNHHKPQQGSWCPLHASRIAQSLVNAPTAQQSPKRQSDSFSASKYWLWFGRWMRSKLREVWASRVTLRHNYGGITGLGDTQICWGSVLRTPKG